MSTNIYSYIILHYAVGITIIIPLAVGGCRRRLSVRSISLTFTIIQILAVYEAFCTAVLQKDRPPLLKGNNTEVFANNFLKGI